MNALILILIVAVVGNEVAATKYKLIPVRKNYFKALDHCLSRGMNLASIESKEENDELVSLIKNEKSISSTYWVGGTRKGFDNPKMESYYWMGKNKLIKDTYNGFKNAEPNNAGDEECLEVLDDWNDTSCDYERPFACEIRSKFTFGLQCENHAFGPFVLSWA